MRQLFVVEPGALVVSKRAFGVEDERRPGLERRLAAFELADADLRALQVGHDRHFAPQRARGVANHARASFVIGGDAVREIQAHDVDAGGEHAREDVRRIAGRAERGDDLGCALHGCSY